jgi:hypothetical protein
MAEATGIRWGWLWLMYGYTIVGVGRIWAGDSRDGGTDEGTVRRDHLDTKIFVFFACVLLVMGHGCSRPTVSESPAPTAGPADSRNGKLEELPVHYETQSGTLARILAESETAKSKVGRAVRQEWYGSTLLGLGRLRKITVPYVPARGDDASRAVTTSQLHKALTEYVLVDYESFRSSIHIPAGTCVTIEYENGLIGWINISGGIPWNVRLQKEGSVGEYGLRRTSEQSVVPEAATPPR